MTPPTPKEPEAISELRSGLAGSRYESCGGYGCYNHTWHMADVLSAYDAMKNERDAWEHRAEVAERENGEALAMLAFTGETSLWQAAAATRAKLDEAVQKARYESEVAAQAMAAKDAAERELDRKASWVEELADVISRGRAENAELRDQLADAERERDDADDALAACQAQSAGTIAQLREKLSEVKRERDDAKINEALSKEQRAVLFCENAKLLAKLAEAEKDAARLDWMADDPPFDGLGDHDLYECWHMVAHENGHEEATQDDRRKAFRRLLDTARTAATAKGE
jgi:hypothetical protein